jgi:Acyl-CoA synthetases (AMP-forming)/AMP-acid ligases II
MMVFEIGLILVTVPFFHVFGLLFLLRTIYYRKPLALYLPWKPPTAKGLLQTILGVKPSCVACAPSILEDVCDLRNGLDVLFEVQSIIYGGEPLAKSCGNKIRRRRSLMPQGAPRPSTFPLCY